VAVHEVAFHPTNGEMVAATHGRSLWACDISALRQLSVDNLKEKIALFKPTDVIRWQSDPSRGRTNRRFVGSNPAGGAQLWYALPTKAERVTLRIEDIEGRVVRELRGATDAGLNRAAWDLVQSPAQSGGGQRGAATTGQRGGTGRGRGGSGRSGTPPAATETRPGPTEGEAAAQPAASQQTEQQEEGERPATGQRGGGRGGGAGGGRPAPSGSYRVVLIVDGRELPAQTIRLERDPNAPPGAVLEESAELGATDAMEEEQEEDEREAREAALGSDRIDD